MKFSRSIIFCKLFSVDILDEDESVVEGVSAEIPRISLGGTPLSKRPRTSRSDNEMINIDGNGCFRCRIKGCIVWRTSQLELYDHIKTDHPLRQHQCTECPMSFELSSNLSKHKMSHSTDAPHKCDVCGKGFSTLSDCNTHQHFVHHKKTFPCPIKKCRARKSSKKELNDHIKSSHPVWNFKCEVCTMSFEHASGLSQHMLTHSQVKPFLCKHCGKRFLLQYSFEKHLLIHTGDRPHKCDVCDRAFTQKSGLERHLLLHTGEKPFPCSLCGRAFRQTSNRNKHEVVCCKRHQL